MSKKMHIKVEWNDGKFNALIKDLALMGLQQWAEVVLGEAKKEVPVLTGTLMRSGLVEPRKADKEIDITFNTPYALRQHEEHKTKSKYLERPFQRLSGRAKGYVERILKKYEFKK